MVEPTPLKNICQIGSSPQGSGLKSNNIWNHHLENGVFHRFFFLPPRGRPQSIAIGLDNVILLGNVAPAPSHPKSPWNLRLSVGVGVVGMEVIYTVGWQPEIPRPNHRLVCIPKPIVNNGNFNYHSLKLVTVAGFLVAINSTTRGWYKLVRCFFFGWHPEGMEVKVITWRYYREGVETFGELKRWWYPFKLVWM